MIDHYHRPEPGNLIHFLSGDDRRRSRGEPPSAGRLQRLWNRFVRSMMEPIPFPGMTYDIKFQENRDDPESNPTESRNDQ